MGLVMRIEIDTLSSREVVEFLQQHIEDMKSVSPPESKHALDLDALRQPNVTFWTVKDSEELVACAALLDLGDLHGEIKSMRTSVRYQQQGIASMLLIHLLNEARTRHYQRVSLETGAMRFFEPARALYRKHGFTGCESFADYQADINSVFMTRLL